MRLNYFQSFGLRNDLSRSFFVFNGEIRLGAWYVFCSILFLFLNMYSLFIHYLLLLTTQHFNSSALKAPFARARALDTSRGGRSHRRGAHTCVRRGAV